jgi:uncharacterized protein (TIGR02757 family)
VTYETKRAPVKNPRYTNGVHYLRDWLESLYATYNARAYIAPDPLEAVYWYERDADREVAGLIAASLAYGRAAQIVTNTRTVLAPMGDSPAGFLAKATPAKLRNRYATFRHRWTTAEELIAVLLGIREVLREHGSLGACFAAHHRLEEGNTLAGLAGLVADLGGPNSMLADPTKPSACKRWHLYLRWMIRKDAVDPGCWTCVDSTALIAPIDTHMHRIALMLGLTSRKQAGLKTALEITEAFRRIRPDDPLRYDFVLTRFGIRPDLSVNTLREASGTPAS